MFLFLLSVCSDSNDEWSALDVCPESARGTFVDERDGEVYKYTTIGNQVWMAENLRYEDFVSTCYYTEDNCKERGRIYPYLVAVNVCPKGWHLPNKDEWRMLIENMDGEDIAGYKLKAIYGWTPLNPGDNPNGTDDCGFSALPSNSLGGKDDGLTLAFWIRFDGDYYLTFRMHSYIDNAYLTAIETNYMVSVRCLKD